MSAEYAAHQCALVKVRSYLLPCHPNSKHTISQE